MGNKNHKYDMDLKFGEANENSLEKILRFGKVEVKTERDIWKKTGNICIEIRQNGHPSGLSTTSADYWAHILSFNNEIESVLIFPIAQLKSRLKQLILLKRVREVKGGDDNKSTLLLVPLKEVFYEDKVS